MSRRVKHLPGKLFGLTMQQAFKLMLCRSLVFATLLVGLGQASLAQTDPEIGDQAPLPTLATAATTLFQNVRIFNGKSAALSVPSNVLIRGSTIERISTSPITVEAGAGADDFEWHACYPFQKVIMGIVA